MSADSDAYRYRLGRPLVTANRDEMIPVFRNVFGSPEGRIVLDFICQELCGVDKRLFYGADAALAYNVARRDVGLDIYHMAMGMVAVKPTVNK